MKSKTKNEPWGPAQPYIIQGLENTQSVFDQQQGRLYDMGDVAYDLFGNISNNAMGPNAFVQSGQSSLGQTLSGDFLNSNPYANMDFFGQQMAGVTDYITNAANRAVGDQFTMAGRTGSPAHSMALTDTITRGLAPFAFNAMDSQIGRAAGAYDAERQRMMQAAGLLPGLRASEFAGIPETLSALESAAIIPWTGVNAYTGNIRQGTGGYGVTTTNSGLGGIIGAAAVGIDGWNKLQGGK